MKNSYFFGALCLLAMACNNNSKTHTGESGPNVTNVENVNGNMADTTNGSTLNSKPPTDSLAVRDSIRK